MAEFMGYLAKNETCPWIANSNKCLLNGLDNIWHDLDWAVVLCLWHLWAPPKLVKFLQLSGSVLITWLSSIPSRRVARFCPVIFHK